jgi:ubiquinone biosynthesis protein UbiJ
METAHGHHRPHAHDPPEHIREDIAKLSTRFDRLESRFNEHDAKNEVEFANLRGALETCVTQQPFTTAMRLSDERFERLHAAMVETNTRVLIGQQELQDTVHQIMQSLGQHGSLAARVDRCEQDIIDLKDRVFRP